MHLFQMLDEEYAWISCQNEGKECIVDFGSGNFGGFPEPIGCPDS